MRILPMGFSCIKLAYGKWIDSAINGLRELGMQVMLNIWNKLHFIGRIYGFSWRRKPYCEHLHGALEKPGHVLFQQAFIPPEIADQLNADSLKEVAFYGLLLQSLPKQALQLSAAERSNTTQGGAGLKVLDIGCKNFFYASSLYFYLADVLQFSEFELHGLEVDTGRLYRNLYRRRDYAEYYCQSINTYLSKPAVFYHQGNWLQWENDQQYHLITVFFPFLFRDLNDGWGLPRSCFSPREFYQKCAKQASRIIFFHQGEHEMQCSKALIESLIRASGRGSILYQGRVHENVYVKRQHPVYSLIWQS
ncbi:MAG: hypothetical protein HRU20_19305 [Pseudomonadales bacterium]|nr:hypothetical protein [Pseudomonadales bacterium]